jgi:hypothetical protein
MTRAIQLASFALLSTMAALSAPRSAHACGGFFCQSTPINQSGENILFAVGEDGTMTTHVQILYTGAAESFAWIVPTPSVPTLAVGTDALFNALASATAPQFFLDYTSEGTCRQPPECNYPDWASGPGGGHDAAAIDAGASGPPDGVTVHFRDAVGPYDAAVITSDDVAAIRTWLDDNGYDIPATADSALDHYVGLNHSFVALKLQQYASVGEIQPIVLRYTEGQPCIPIVLTAIATMPDMPITAYVLGNRNARPINYMSVDPDLDDPVLFLSDYDGTMYRRKVSEAVDESGGRGFVTEFAGLNPGVSIALPAIDDLATETHVPTFVRRLLDYGFSGDAQLLALLQRFIPPPEGEDATSFYNCLAQPWCIDDGTGGSRYDEYFATLMFDPAAFVAALNAAIVHPRRDAQELVKAHARLTRLFTTMSAEEMTEDPIIMLSDARSDVSNVHRATLVTECSSDYYQYGAPQRMDFPSGTTARVSAGRRANPTEHCGSYGVREIYGDGTGSSGKEIRAGGGGLCSIGAMDATNGTIPLLILGLAATLAIRRRRTT